MLPTATRLSAVLSALVLVAGFLATPPTLVRAVSGSTGARTAQAADRGGVPAEPLVVTGNLTASDFTSTDQVIVRWEDAGASGSASDIGAEPDRVNRVTAAAGEQATWLRALAVGGQVYRFSSRLSPERSAAMVAALRAQPGVASVEPDQIFQAVTSPPDDPYWTTPAPGQWDLSEGTTTTTYGIDLLGGWDRTLGAGVVVAVLDTGMTTHPDLAGQTVAGYDFISNLQTANDGNGRDANPSDPGDWCRTTRSSWHGTHVSGTIAALTNNAIGIAGIAPSAKIQPVRVLGKCGGYLSDIADAIVWASGGAVSGAPANATPARVINMSLGGSGPCSTTYQTAINGAVSRGTVVAVAAGNDGADASGSSPANCAGVITVAATDRNGARASFSNYGSVVEIAAPGVSLWSTLNDGATVPGNPIYAQYSGTSMAAPHVAGVAALMLAANPSLTPAQVVALMQQTAHPFAAGGCPPGCGSGIVDAATAVAAALPPPVTLPPAVTSIAPANGPDAGGTTVTLAGTGFTGATAVSFGGSAAASFAVSSDTQISAVSPAGTGTVDVTVTGPGGTSATSSADQFTYFVPDTSGATYVSLTPTRLLDTRIGNGLSGTFNTAVARTFQVTGRGGVPANAIAVTGNLTVTNQTAFGHVSLTPDPTDNPTTSTLNFPVADNRANGVTAPLSATGTLSATYITSGPGQTTDLVFDVTGYFVPDTSGATYVSLTPTRLLDTRIGNGLSGTFNTAVARTFQVTGRGGVPANAIAVTGNLTVTNQTAFGHVSLTPDPTDNPTTSTLNFPVADNRANGVTAPLSATGTLSATYITSGPGQTTDLVFDVTGYFVPDTSGATYVSLTPTRLLDTRIGNGLSGTFNTAVARTFQVTGRGGVPANAIAVTGNLTVTNQTAFGHVSLTPDPTDNPTTSTLNFPVADNRANGVTAPLSATGTLSATYITSGPGQTTDLVFDVTGYFVP